ncbi:pre-60S factor rei1 [Coemansia thaxteri]|nr:pre-60S factor rei1 [Coemansia thaxteri]
MDDSTAATASTAQTPTGSVPTNAQNTPLFTCMACQVAFYSADQQRTHYRSDWHRYNLKRKVADLPAVSAESFAQRVLAQQAKAVEISKRAEFSAECKVLEEEDGELVLPSGSRIGHRSLQRYYRQTIPSEQPEKESVVIHKMLTNYAENPEYCNQLVQCSRNRAVILAQNNGQRAWKDIATFKENRARENFQTRVGVKANRLQRYFREQLI